MTGLSAISSGARARITRYLVEGGGAARAGRGAGGGRERGARALGLRRARGALASGVCTVAENETKAPRAVTDR